MSDAANPIVNVVNMGSSTVVTVGDASQFPVGSRICFSGGAVRIVTAFDVGASTLTYRDLRWYERAADAVRTWWRAVRRASTWLRGVTGR